MSKSNTNEVASTSTPATEIWSEADLAAHAAAATSPAIQTIARPTHKGKEVPMYGSTPEREELLKTHGDTSKAIRFLVSQGLKDGDVARRLNIRPQHVNNVKKQILKKA